jgi:preprotein translocase subunit SecG
MKIFIYKFIIILIGLFFLFEITIGSLVKKYENKIINLTSKQNKEYILDKVRKEVKESLNKEKIFNEDDAKLINSILKKVFSEINIKN